MFYPTVYVLIGLILCVLVGLLANQKRFRDPILTSPMSLLMILLFWPFAVCVFIYGASLGFIRGKRKRKKLKETPLISFDPLLNVMQNALKEKKKP